MEKDGREHNQPIVMVYPVKAGWKVKTKGNKRAYRIMPLYIDALNIAIRIAINKNAELRIRLKM